MFHTIVTHKNSHLDEICAIFMFLKAGEKKFPGISEAKVTFDGSGGEKLHGCSAREWEEQGVLCVGVGGGRFDEHPGPGVSKKEDECATTLVAKTLGIEREPVWEKIIEFVKYSDLKAGGRPFDLAQLIKDMHQAFPEDPQKVFDWALLALEAKYRSQLGFLSAAEELEKNVAGENIRLKDGRVIRMITAVTENPNFNKAARSKGFAVVIQQQPSGNVQVFIDNRVEGLNLYGVASLLRTEEARVNNRQITTDKEQLQTEGKVAGAEEWFLLNGRILLNGSLTNPNTPTKVPLNRIGEIVRQGIENC